MFRVHTDSSVLSQAPVPVHILVSCHQWQCFVLISVLTQVLVPVQVPVFCLKYSTSVLTQILVPLLVPVFCLRCLSSVLTQMLVPVQGPVFCLDCQCHVLVMSYHCSPVYNALSALPCIACTCLITAPLQIMPYRCSPTYHVLSALPYGHIMSDQRPPYISCTCCTSDLTPMVVPWQTVLWQMW